MARRLAQRDVRFIQISHEYRTGNEVGWDAHSELIRLHTRTALQVDQPIHGLLTDLKAHGLLKDTLVVWGGEFGRTPIAQGGDGRDHNPYGYTMWMAGGGVKGGIGLRRNRRLWLLRGGGSHAHPRSARDDPAHPRHGSQAVDVLLRRAQFPADRCLWRGGAQNSCVTGSAFHFSGLISPIRIRYDAAPRTRTPEAMANAR